MKLNELKESLSDLGYRYRIKDDNFVVYSNEKLKTRDDYKMIGQVSLVEPFNMRTYTSDPMLLTYLFNFSKTKLSEREEEKKFFFQCVLSHRYHIHGDVIPLFLVKEHPKQYAFYHDRRDLFTEDEVNRFPSSILSAIDSGFLEKVEV